MSGPLATIYSQSELLKKRLRDLLANPINYTQAAADRLREDTQDPMFAANFLTGSPGAFAGVIKPKGGNWLAGSVEDALHGLKRNQSSLPLEVLRPEEQAIQRINAPINQWIEGPLTKYIKTRMASPDDEIRKLAEQGVLHFEPATIRERSTLMEKIVGRRETAGFPIQGVADAPLARNWENTADSLIRNLEARDISSAERAASFGGKSNIPGDTIVHEMNPFASGAGISDIGFDHLIDELSNALNPNSGLPRNLQLSPEAIKNLSMDKAIRRVSDINAWRAAQKIEANRKLAEQASLVREYAENNPRGLRWVELKKQEALPEGWSFKPGEGEYAGHDWFFDPQGKAHNALNDPRNQMLADQLKYEGDTMGHCVGGYCDDVASGASRIFSLRDAKGQPHVTIEVRPGERSPLRNTMVGHEYDQLLREYNAAVKSGKVDPNTTDVESFYYKGEPPTPRIVQIKGKQNRAPNEEYLPFVQDFVRNSPLGQPWSHVGDIQHTDLVNIPKGKTVTIDGRSVILPEGYQSVESLRNLLSHPDIHPELSDAQAEVLYNIYLRGNNYAEGGSIRSTPSVIDLIRNDPELQALPKNILKSLLNFGRGSVAALGGIGGDLTALGGTLLGNEVTGHGDTFLPTTSDLLRRLPQLPDDWKDYEVQQAGTFDPGIVPTALPKLGGAMARLGAEAIHQGTHGAGPLRDILRAAAPLSVIKPKGGNWLAGSVEDALRGLKKEGFTREQLVAMRDARLGKQTNGLNAYGEPLEDVDLIQELRARPEYRNLPPSYAQQAMLSAPQASINSWIEGPLTKYVKTRMASPDDEVRKLAEHGVLHVDPAQLHAPIGLHSGVTRQELGQSPVAKRWEFASDSFIAPETAGLFKVTRGQDGSTTLSRNPWLADLPNEATVYDLGARAHPDNLGFPHLIDELSNALNPASGLPRNLQLTPEAMQNMSMEKAVRRVADINAWRAAQKVEANRKLAEQASLVRDYPHSEAMPNPKGLRWVELKANELAKDAGPVPEELNKENFGLEAWQRRNPPKESYNRALKEYLAGQEGTGPDVSFSEAMWKADPEWVSREFKLDSPAQQARQKLQDQLKYEGDTMGNCVGGYCDDVLSGRSRIFSLRDAKGEPHVTIEVQPKGRVFDRVGGFDDMDLQRAMFENVPRNQHRRLQKWLEEEWEGGDLAEELTNSPFAQYLPPKVEVPRIVQIKGKQNRKPNDEYLPFVQDFVRNPPHGQPWSEVGDLGNAGLPHRLSDFSPEVRAAMGQYDIKAPGEYLSTEEVNSILNAINKAKGFASGGSVRSRADLGNLIASLQGT